MNKAILICAPPAFALAILLNTANATAVVVGVDPGPNSINIEGVTTDLFDIAQGTVITAASAQLNNGTISDPRSAFGYMSSFVEPSRTIFADSPSNPTDFIDFQTAQPINLGNYQLFLGEDGNGTDGRSATAFRLYASSNSGDVQSHLVSSATFSGTFTATYGYPSIMVSDSLNLSNVQYFRVEVDRSNLAIDPGPRVIELDGFAPTPEPSSVVLFGLGALSLFLVARRRSRSSAE